MKKDSKSVLLTKIISYSTIVVFLIVGFCIIPKKAVSYDSVYSAAVSLGDIREETTLLYDLKIYENKDNFDQGLESDVSDIFCKFKNRGEILLIKIPGSNYSLTNENDYWVQVDDSIKDLRIEYYLITNIHFDNYSLPCKTVMNFLNDELAIINIIYILAIILVMILLLIPFSIGIVRCVTKLKKINLAN